MNRSLLSVAVLAISLSACVQDGRVVESSDEKLESEQDAVARNRPVQTEPARAGRLERDAAQVSAQVTAPVIIEFEKKQALKTDSPPGTVMEEIAAVNGASADMAMSSAPSTAARHKMRHHSPAPQWQPEDRENYLEFRENGLQQVAAQPVSTFSIDVDTAAYSNVRRMLLREGRLPPRDAVKIEEFINYFDYSYTNPRDSDTPFSINTGIARTPWNQDSYLLQVGLRGYEPGLEQRPPANLVFLVDVSGSMRSQHKLELVKKSLRLLVNQLGEEDRVALVVYAGAAGQVLESTPGSQRATILAAIEQLEAGGSTNGGAGIQLAYSIAEQHRIEGGINRVLIASDGDMNVGMTSLDALKELVEKKRERGIALTTLGYGTGNYNYALMEQLADVGNGNAAYIDNLKEAQKVLVRQMGSTLQTIAKDVKIQVEFNPATVAEYRLIGYENRMLQREDFKNDKVDAGDIGVGHTVTALYEITLVDSASSRVHPLRYGEPVTRQPRKNSLTDELAFVRLRFKDPQGKVSREVSRPIQASQIRNSMEQADGDFRFAAAVAGFGQLLRGGKYTGDWSYPELIELARSSRGADDDGYRAELVALVELSRDLAGEPEA